VPDAFPLKSSGKASCQGENLSCQAQKCALAAGQERMDKQGKPHRPSIAVIGSWLGRGFVILDFFPDKRPGENKDGETNDCNDCQEIEIDKSDNDQDQPQDQVYHGESRIPLTEFVGLVEAYDSQSEQQYLGQQLVEPPGIINKPTNNDHSQNDRSEHPKDCGEFL